VSVVIVFVFVIKNNETIKRVIINVQFTQVCIVYTSTVPVHVHKYQIPRTLCSEIFG
jgi:hypothetical protein